jgi:hypothetical protein
MSAVPFNLPRGSGLRKTQNSCKCQTKGRRVMSTTSVKYLLSEDIRGRHAGRARWRGSSADQRIVSRHRAAPTPNPLRTVTLNRNKLCSHCSLAASRRVGPETWWLKRNAHEMSARSEITGHCTSQFFAMKPRHRPPFRLTDQGLLLYVSKSNRRGDRPHPNERLPVTKKPFSRDLPPPAPQGVFL